MKGPRAVDLTDEQRIDPAIEAEVVAWLAAMRQAATGAPK